MAQSYYKTWAAKNADKVKKYRATWAAKNKGKIRAYMAKWRAKNKLKLRKDKQEWSKKNPDKRKASNAKYYAANKLKLLQQHKKWKDSNKHKVKKHRQARRARLQLATPTWLCMEDRINMAGLYNMAKALSVQTGIKHEVDHIMPLSGKAVCGLNVPWNLQIVSREFNRKKGAVCL